MNNNPPAVEPRPPPSLTPWHWGWAAGLAAIVLVTFAVRYALPIRDGDIWWHMLYGQYFLEHKTLIADHTIFSWTPATNDTIYCTWLPDIFLYLLHKYTGLPGLFAFRYLCLFILPALCFFFARRRSIASHPWTWLLCLLALLLSFSAAFEKPEILSFVFMTLLAWNWWHIRGSGPEAWRRCYLFPLILLVWVNSHGGFIFGVVFLLLIGLGELLNTWLSPANILAGRVRRHLLFALLLCAITPLLTPYGLSYPLQLASSLLPTTANLQYNAKVAAHTAPFDTADIFLFARGADVALLLLLLLLLRNFRRLEWSTLLANMVFAFLFTRYFRTTFYWPPVFLFSALHLLSQAPVIPPHWRGARHLARLLLLLTVLASCWFSGKGIYLSALFPEQTAWLGFGIGGLSPVAEAEYIRRYFPHARIGNTYDQGAYLLWRLWPRNRVFFDSRHFPYRAWSDQFFAFSRGEDIRDMLRQYPCDLWCISISASRDLILQMLREGNWRLAFRGRNAAVLVRQDIPLPLDSPRVSHDLLAPRSIYEATYSLILSCSMLDLETAGKELTAMQRIFPHAPHRPSLLWADHLYQGTRAYTEGDFASAVKRLRSMANPPETARYLLLDAALRMTALAWSQGKDDEAQVFARTAWQAAPTSPHALFNLGVTLRQHRNGENPPDWRRPLQDFLQRTSEAEDFEPFRQVAQNMIAERQQGRPPVLVPPPPLFPAADSP